MKMYDFAMKDDYFVSALKEQAVKTLNEATTIERSLDS